MVPIYATFFLIHEKYSCENIHGTTIDIAAFASLPKELAIAFLAHNSLSIFVD
jgi:hypothetical protein